MILNLKKLVIQILPIFDFLLKPLFLGLVEKNQEPVFKLESPSRLCIFILNGAQNLKFIDFLYATLIGWILYTFQDIITRLGKSLY